MCQKNIKAQWEQPMHKDSVPCPSWWGQVFASTTTTTVALLAIAFRRQPLSSGSNLTALTTEHMSVWCYLGHACFIYIGWLPLGQSVPLFPLKNKGFWWHFPIHRCRTAQKIQYWHCCRTAIYFFKKEGWSDYMEQNAYCLMWINSGQSAGVVLCYGV